MNVFLENSNQIDQNMIMKQNQYLEISNQK